MGHLLHNRKLSHNGSSVCGMYCTVRDPDRTGMERGTDMTGENKSQCWSQKLGNNNEGMPSKRWEQEL